MSLKEAEKFSIISWSANSRAETLLFPRADIRTPQHACSPFSKYFNLVRGFN